MAQHSLDLTTRATAHRLLVERLPELVDRIFAWLGTRIDEHADVGVKNAAERLEKPSMRVDLLLILLFQAEEHLHWSVALLDLHNALLDLQRHLSSVLNDVSKVKANCGMLPTS